MGPISWARGGEARRRAERREHLASLWLFAGLSGRSLDRVDSLAAEVDLPAGTVLVRKGTVGREVFVISSGQIDISTGSLLIGRRFAGDLVGELAVMDRCVRVADATAADAVRVLAFDPRSFWALLGEPPVGERVRALAESRRKANEILLAHEVDFGTELRHHVVSRAV